MRPSRWMTYAVVCLFYLATLGQAAEVRKVTQEDVEWGDPSTTVTSPGGHVGHRIDNTFRVAAGWINITAPPYGAVPDDQSASVMSANVVAIQAALDAAKTSGAPVFIPAGVFHTNGPLMAQDFWDDDSSPYQLYMYGTGVSTIWGHDFNAPVINFGGSMVRAQDINFYSDNTSHVAVMYRTPTYNPVSGSGSGSRFFRCSFSGNATKAIITEIAHEVTTFDTCRIQPRDNDIPGIEWANTDIWGYSAAGYLPNWFGSASSNTMLKVINSYHDQSGTVTKAMIRIHDGDNFIIQNNGFTRSTGGYGIQIGNDYGYSVGYATISGNRDESTAGGPFLYISMSQVTQLIYEGNVITTPANKRIGAPVNPPDGTNTYAIYVDNDVVIGQARMGPNYSGFGLEYRLGIIDQSFIFAPNDLVSTYSTIGLGIQNSFVYAKEVYYTGTKPQSLNSQVNIYGNPAAMRQEYMGLLTRTADPIYSLGDSSFGTIAVPDGSGWNPTGIGNTPHYPVLSGGTIKWVTPAFIADLATPPATATTGCKPPQFALDNNYRYDCVATDTWRRSAIVGW